MTGRNKKMSEKLLNRIVENHIEMVLIEKQQNNELN